MIRLGTRVRIEILIEPRDLWVGIYWTTKPCVGGHAYHFYLCLLPCLPVHLVLMPWEEKHDA